MTDPFRIEGPAAISFSGGRTSAFMLRRILDAHGGTLPPDIHVLFANTGKEREETLAFVRDCAASWGVAIHWLEYAPKMGGDRVDFREVAFATAARAGEPFAAMMDHERFVPNSLRRICTQNLKILVMAAYMKARGYGPGDHAEVVGFRADEAERVAKSRANPKNADGVLRFPLHAAGVTQADVLAFWRRQPFDLGLQPHESNCDLCFLKGDKIRLRILRARPELGAWWVEQEARRGERFGKRDRKSYADLVQIARARPALPHAEAAGLEDGPMPCGCHD